MKTRNIITVAIIAIILVAMQVVGGSSTVSAADCKFKLVPPTSANGEWQVTFDTTTCPADYAAAILKGLQGTTSVAPVTGSTPAPTATLVARATATATPAAVQSSKVSYTYTTMDLYKYPVEKYEPGTTLDTPQQKAAVPTGAKTWRQDDVGVPIGVFTIVKGYEIQFDGHTWGGDKENGCALIVLSPGYYYGLKTYEAITESYWLPSISARYPKWDATGWSGVLADQASGTEQAAYQCLPKNRSQITVITSSMPAPFAP